MRLELPTGKRIRAVPTKNGEDGPVEEPVTWATSNPAVLTVEGPMPDGPGFARLTLVAAGSADITASYRGQTASMSFDVVAAPFIPDGLRLEVSELE